MGTDTLTAMDEKSRSARIVPIGANEDVVVLHVGEEQHLAKILDLSNGGPCVYTIEPGFPLDVGETCGMSLYHNKNILDLDVRVSRKVGQVVWLEFQSPSAEAREQVSAKIIRLEVEWMRMKPNV